MTTTEFNKEIKNFQEEMCKLVTNVFKEAKEIRPMLAAYMYKKDAICKEIGILSDFEPMLANEVTKRALKELFRDSLENVKPLVIAFITEGWGISINKYNNKSIEDIKKAMKGKRVSEMDDKIEVVYLTLETAATHCNIVYKIDRTDKDNPVLIYDENLSGEWEPKNYEMEGTLQNILNVDYHPIANLNSIN